MITKVIVRTNSQLLSITALQQPGRGAVRVPSFVQEGLMWSDSRLKVEIF